MKLNRLITGAALALGLVMGGAASAATIVNLGFAIDKSGSVDAGDFTLQQQGLANALSLIPTTGDVQYRVSVVAFGSDVTNLVTPQIVTAGNIGTIQSAITGYSRSGTSSTQTDDAINRLTSLFDPYDMENTLTLYNISTDGSPSSQSATLTAANNAVAAGVDGISVELVGSFSTGQINNMLAITSPTPSEYVTVAGDLPNPTEAGFVFAVENFADYEAAISAKIQRIVDDTGGGDGVIPLPAGMPLMLSVIGVFAFVRRKRAAA
ncbi:VPLPA-CTERM protein sorting domain-containing protein [Lutimaribacter pacificus]|uniref:VPLPA-CTERM protein sorting domain-containing protein n=1 Tax=Lutimaribacter pacificus TaxID=391948 RepID=A0A1H0CY43_9RHOB|nr:VWA domain-containing protein [Lutimaribacter pacificus]SDN62807.1 VPLPA-CTERM protein sorting domain-containing protein [Lutimaribacter pacificus]SHJ39307.1 VPLPA-CTERM protein sorting domain-containing protein [Lutimaribacter pacificus]